MHNVGFLAEPIDAANAVLDHHWIPGQVIVDQVVAELKVEALATDLSGNEHFDVRVRLKLSDAFASLIDLGPARIRMYVSIDS